MSAFTAVKQMSAADRKNLIRITVIIGFACSVIFHYVAGAYMNMGYPYSTFLFDPRDRFHDFLNIYRATTDLNPFADPVSVYFPFTYMPVYILTFIPPFIAYAVFAAAFLAFLLAAQHRFIPAEGTIDRVLTMFSLTVLSYPVLFILDRGNLECLVFIFLWLFIYCYKNRRDTAAALFLSFAIAMKLYPGVFCVLFLADRRWKPLLLTAVSTLVLTIASAALLDGGISASLAGMQNNLLIFKAQYFESVNGLLYNSSLYVPAVLMASKFAFMDVIPKGYPLCAIFLFILTAAYVAFREDVFWKRIALLSYMMILLPQISFDYKLIHIFLPLLLFLGSEPRSKFDVAYSVIFGLLLIPKDYFFLVGNISINGILNSFLMLAFIGFIIADKRMEPAA